MKIKEFINRGVDLSSLHRIYIYMWIITVILYSLHFVGYYGLFEWDGELALFLVATLIAMLISGISFKRSKCYKDKVDFNTLFNVHAMKFITNKANCLFWIWVFGNLVTVILQGGFPLLWLVLGIPKTYADYGIPTVNGFLNSLFYICGVFYFLTMFKARNRCNILRFAILVIFPILIINRALFLVLILQCLGLFILTNKIKIKAILIIVSLFLVLVIGFGSIGDMRLGENKNIVRDLVSDEYSELKEEIPSGFIWTYLYATGTIDNLNYNIESIEAIGYPYYTIMPLIPSVFRSLIFGVTDYEDSYSLSMSNTMFNTFSWLANFLRDFGPALTVIIVYLFGCLFKKVQTRARKGNIKHIFLYPIMFMVVVLSIFWDYMISLPTIFEIIIICIIFNSRVIQMFEEEALFDAL